MSIASHVQTNAFHVGLQPVEGSTCSEIWSIESTDATQQPGADAEFLNQYQQSCIRRESNGAYCVKFPWKQEHPPLPTNYMIL